MKECPACKRELKDQLLYCPFDGQALVDKPVTDKLVGVLIDDKYRIEEKVGEGGMGTVYRATHVLMDNTVAIKVLHPHLSSDKTALERFRREARATAHIRHPNAVAVLDFGVTRDSGIAYLVMEFLEGVELRQRLKLKRLDYEEIWNIIQQTCSAVQAAHSKSIIHRDLKPDNIWLLKDEEGIERVKVLDFGIAKLKTFAESGNLTQQGMIVGTPYYMSPEQCRGDELDARSDIYSLGVIVYEMLAGDVPFRAATPMGIVLKHASEPPRPLREIRPEIPVQVEEVVLRALEKKREQRQDTAVKFGQELEAAMLAAGIEIKSLMRTPQSILGTLAGQPADTQRMSQIGPRQSAEALAFSEASVAGPDGRAEPALKPAPPATPTPDVQPIPRLAPDTPPFLSRDISSVTQIVGKKKLLAVGTLAAILVIGIIIWLAIPRPGPKPPDPPKPKPIEAPPGMVYIPGGKFTMGNNQSLNEADKPEHEAEVDPFFIDQYEVTNDDYQRFLEGTPKYPAPENWRNRKFPDGKGRNPVTNVTYDDARHFGLWSGKRLPTETEWEYAARGTDRRLYPWGNEFDVTKANVKEAGIGKALQVDSFRGDESPFHVFGMGGNVFEWTRLLYEPYENSRALPSPNEFVLRGGDYAGDGKKYTVAFRRSAKADVKSERLGFRCAKDLPRQ